MATEVKNLIKSLDEDYDEIYKLLNIIDIKVEKVKRILYENEELIESVKDEVMMLNHIITDMIYVLEKQHSLGCNN